MFNFFVIIFVQLTWADFRYSLDSIFIAQRNEVIDSVINPSNTVLDLPTEEYNIDLRSDLKWLSDRNKIVLRPHINSHFRKKTDFDLTDAFIETNWSDSYSTTIGLQVYQWGPTEFINASNPFFHFSSKQKNLYYKEKGQVIFRNNISIDKENNIVLSLMPISNNESQFIEGEEFVAKALLKYEKSWTESINSVGFVAGFEEKKNFFIGEYFNFSFLESSSFYADIKHAKNKTNFQPISNGSSYDLDFKTNKSDLGYILADIGLRYESDIDLRLEFIYNEAGFDQAELKQAIQSASNRISTNYAINLKRFFKSGLEILGRNYLYSSVRKTETFGYKDLNLYARCLYSLQDDSRQLQLEFDKSFLDSFNIFANQTLSYGDINSEFRLQNSWSFVIGLKYSL